VALIESGMGPAHAADAARALIAAAAPRVLVNFGFAGGVLPGLRAGELVLAERAYRLEGSTIVEAPRPDAALSRLVGEACRAAGLELRTGSFITACGITRKDELAASVKAELALPVLEMETAAVLQVAHEAGIPVVALRGVSDAADEELGFSIEELCDRELNLSPTRLVMTLARKPYLVPQLIRLAGNARKAGRGLARGVEIALQALSGNPKD
jgi:adenosylhomocysteine nucleosidase